MPRKLHLGGSVPPPTLSLTLAVQPQPLPSWMEPGYYLQTHGVLHPVQAPQGLQINIPSRSCFLLVWEQGCVAEPAGRPATCIPMGLRLRLQHRT